MFAGAFAWYQESSTALSVPVENLSDSQILSSLTASIDVKKKGVTFTHYLLPLPLQ